MTSKTQSIWMLSGVSSLLAAVAVAMAGPSGSGDWPMWGGTPTRNMVSSMKGLPTTWDIASSKNLKWVAKLGSQTYGNPVVSKGVVLVGTNNELVRDPKQPGRGTGLPARHC